MDIAMSPDQFPSINGPFPQSLRQSSGFLVRRTLSTSPRNPLIFLTLLKIAHLWIGNTTQRRPEFPDGHY
jgi:hypothetical protein